MEYPDIRHFITRGVIIKEEKVKSITSHIISDTLVLENYEPFPGYYGGNLPTDIRPMSVFIVLEKEYNILQLGRIIKNISLERKHKCDGTTATISTMTTRYFCIRINNLDCFADIRNIQESITRHGISLSRGKNMDETVLIEVQKTFLLEKLKNDIYKDLIEESYFYFTLDDIGSWERFKKLTIIVKQNITNYLFDSALGHIWNIDGPDDMVRIYHRKYSEETILDIRDFYQKAMKRI